MSLTDSDSETAFSTSDKDTKETQLQTVVTLKTLQSWKDSLTCMDQQIIKAIAKYTHAIIEPLYSANSTKIREAVELENSENNLSFLFDVAFVQLPVSLSKTFSQPKKETIQKPSNWNASMSLPMKLLLDSCILILSKASLTSWQYDFLVKNSLEHYHQYFLLFPKLLKTLLQQLAIRWSECPSTSETKRGSHKNHDLRPNLLALVHLNRVAQLPSKRLFVMKCMYEAFGRVCPDHLVSHQIEHIKFMLQSMIEVFQSCPSQLLYEHSFLSLKALITPISRALHEPKLEHLSAVSTWSFVLKAAFWVRLFVPKRSDESIKLLLYPLIQIILCASQLTHSMTLFFPFHVHLYHILLYWMQFRDDIYIPIEDKLIQTLQHVKLVGKKSEKSQIPVPFALVVRVENAYEHTQLYHQNVIEQVFNLLEMILKLMQNRTCFSEWADIMIHKLNQLKSKSSILLTKCIDEWICKVKDLLLLQQRNESVKSDGKNPEYLISTKDQSALNIRERFYLSS